MDDTAEIRAQIRAIDNALERMHGRDQRALSDLTAERKVLRDVLEQRERARFIDRLRSNDRDAVKVRAWLGKQKRVTGWAAETGRDCGDVDAFLLSLSAFVWSLRPVADWDTVPAKERTRRIRRVANAARTLAGLLDATPGPNWPDAIALFDRTPAVNLLARLYPSESVDVLRESLEPPDVLSLTLRSQPGQTVSGILRNLASYADMHARRVSTKEPRPRTGEVDARAFAAAVADYLHSSLRLTRNPCEVIACIIALRFPDIELLPTAETVRSWIA